jgi:hypothetical protein
MQKLRPRPDGADMADFEVLAAVFNVTRGKGVDAETESYERGEQVSLTRAYANEYCKAKLLRLVQDQGESGPAGTAPGQFSDADEADEGGPVGDADDDGAVSKYEAMPKTQLQELCAENGLGTSGTGKQLAKRLDAHDRDLAQHAPVNPQ